ncbi:MAG: hypothetical protein QHH07_07470 [Sedimentisphaerales bacterium]|nr:hypothetical protein [Sedimentisphaerales bacterium]
MNSHTNTFRYTFRIDEDEAFMQTGSPDRAVTYWLCAQASIDQQQGSLVRFNWKTSTSYWGDDAVWAQAQEPSAGAWSKLNYPSTHPRVGQHTALAFAVLTSHYSTTEFIDRQVADDWKAGQSSPVIAATWWGSYIGCRYKPCECNKLTPTPPDYFLLSIWSDRPASAGAGFSRPDKKLWEYKAFKYDQIQVGFDKQPLTGGDSGYEPVFRYSVQIPADKVFIPNANEVYWFSVVAVYLGQKEVTYPWGWTNHEYMFNDTAVAGSETTDASGKKTWTWQPP